MANGLVPDISPFSGGVGSFISDRINRRLEERALGGDTLKDRNLARSRLASRDPRSAAQIGSILRSQQEEQQLLRQQQREIQSQQDDFKRRISNSFVSATTPEAKKRVLESVIPSLQGRPGFENFIPE